MESEILPSKSRAVEIKLRSPPIHLSVLVVSNGKKST